MNTFAPFHKEFLCPAANYACDTLRALPGQLSFTASQWTCCITAQGCQGLDRTHAQSEQTSTWQETSRGAQGKLCASRHVVFVRRAQDLGNAVHLICLILAWKHGLAK